MERDTYAAMVSTVTQVEVLRTAFVALATHIIGLAPAERRESMLQDIQSAAGLLPERELSGGDVHSFLYAEVRNQAPRYAEDLVQDIRKSLP